MRQSRRRRPQRELQVVETSGLILTAMPLSLIVTKVTAELHKESDVDRVLLANYLLIRDSSLEGRHKYGILHTLEKHLRGSGCRFAVPHRRGAVPSHQSRSRVSQKLLMGGTAARHGGTTKTKSLPVSVPSSSKMPLECHFITTDDPKPY
jgi:hypothetical protein